MKIYSDINTFYSKSSPKVIVIGNFDGVHLGHQKLLKEAKAQAHELSSELCVLSFDPHPRTYFKDPHFFRIYSKAHNLAKLKNFGVDQVLLVPFNAAFAELTDKEFIEVYLNKPNLSSIHLGKDFRFGHNRCGNVQSLESFFWTFGQPQVHLFNDFIIKGQKISSSLIRSFLSEGRVAKLKDFLGEVYNIEASIYSDRGVGAEIGTPTLNVKGSEYGLRKGVYITQLYCDDEPLSYPAISNFGVRPSFLNTKELVLETHVLPESFMQSPEKIKIEFLEFIRDEVSFDSVDDLKSQIQKDIKIARKFHEL